MYSNQGPGYVFVERHGTRNFIVEEDEANEEQVAPQVAHVAGVRRTPTPPPPLEGDTDDKLEMFIEQDWD